MTTFTPPTITAVPPVSVADTQTAPDYRTVNPQGYNLMRWFPSRNRGVNVWVMDDGTVLMSDPVPGVPFNGTIAWPYPDTDNPVNGAISSSWFSGGPGGVGGSGPAGSIVPAPGIAYEFLGAHTYPNLPPAVVTTLTNAGLGAFLT